MLRYFNFKAQIILNTNRTFGITYRKMPEATMQPRKVISPGLSIKFEH